MVVVHAPESTRVYLLPYIYNIIMMSVGEICLRNPREMSRAYGGGHILMLAVTVVGEGVWLFRHAG